MYTMRESTPTIIRPMAMGQEFFMQPEFEPSSTPFNHLSEANQSPMPRYLLRIHILSAKGLKANALNPFAVKQMMCSLILQSGGSLLHSANTNAVNVQVCVCVCVFRVFCEFPCTRFSAFPCSQGTRASTVACD